MTTFFTIDRANERIPEVRELLLLLRSQRDELVRLRDRYVQLAGGIGLDDRPDEGPDEGPDDRPDEGLDDDAAGSDEAVRPDAEGGSGGPDPGRQELLGGSGPTLTEHREARLVKLRIRGIVDQMGASVTRIDEWGITLRDIPTGLIDFPALVSGRQVWLCWRLGEGDIAWWHELDAGFSGRQRLEDLH